MNLPFIKTHMVVNSSQIEGGSCAGQPRRKTSITRILKHVSYQLLLSHQSPTQSGVEAGQEIGLALHPIAGQEGLCEEGRLSRTYLSLGQSFLKSTKVSKRRDCFLSNFSPLYFIQNTVYSSCYINTY